MRATKFSYKKAPCGAFCFCIMQITFVLQISRLCGVDPDTSPLT
jgi:hypothetical protein